jgi:dTDP-4-amino-4,6-dideoxygalactose transaminase
MKHLEKQGIESKVFYPAPVYMQPLYQQLGYAQGLCPASEKAAREVLSIPVHPQLTREELETIAGQVRSFFD